VGKGAVVRRVGRVRANGERGGEGVGGLVGRGGGGE